MDTCHGIGDHKGKKYSNNNAIIGTNYSVKPVAGKHNVNPSTGIPRAFLRCN